MKEKMVRVLATGRGHDGVQVREAGEEFDMPESLFDTKVATTDSAGKKTGEVEIRQPSWFERKEKKAAPATEDQGNDLA